LLLFEKIPSWFRILTDAFHMSFLNSCGDE